ncbi:MAG: recombinase family protein [Prochlorotrichaceae cyanobacterium]
MVLTQSLPKATLPQWICGTTRSGKTTRLIQGFCQWAEGRSPHALAGNQSTQAIVLGSTGDNQIRLRQEIFAASPQACSPYTTSPLGFMQQEVVLFWPLIADRLGLSVLFPLRLRSETEQELACQLWETIVFGKGQLPPKTLDRAVRNELDLFMLAINRGLPWEIQADGSPSVAAILATKTEEAHELGLTHLRLETWITWRNWCLERGFLTYSIMTELFHGVLLPDPQYQATLPQRFSAIFADDVDEYPAVMGQLFEILLQNGLGGIFTENPQGSVRLGFGADPLAFASLASRCHRVELSPPQDALAHYGSLFLQLLQPQPPSIGFDPFDVQDSPIQVLQTTLRGDLLRQISNRIGESVRQGEVQPTDIALITPGLDGITRYSFQEMLVKQGIDVLPLAEQRSLIEVPIVGALLTLLALVYEGVGELVDRDRVAELLTVLSEAHQGSRSDRFSPMNPMSPPIDAVRAGLLADHCYRPDPLHPSLLDFQVYPRWDRLGYLATQQYDRLRDWIQAQRQALRQELVDPPILLDRALQKFFALHHHLTYAQLAALRELMETATHYWEVRSRLEDGKHPPGQTPIIYADSLRDFIQLLRQGTIAANPYPVHSTTPPNAVTLATIFQYRLNHCCHRWQFWLDVGSPRWLLKNGGLTAADWFLTGLPDSLAQPGQPLSLGELRLERNLLDLLGRSAVVKPHPEHPDHANQADKTIVASPRSSPRIYLCHSDLATNGQEQMGVLLPLVYAGFPSQED